MGSRRPKRRKPWGKIPAALVCLLIFAQTVLALVPAATTQDVTQTNGKLTVNVTDIGEGYFSAYCKVSTRRMKMRVAYNEELLTYDLDSSGVEEVFPLQFGSGTYTVSLYENAGGNRYSQAGKITFEAVLEDERAAFLRPSQYVNYTEETEAVLLGQQICEGLETEKEKFEAIKAYLKKNFTYDYIRAVTVQSGTLPDIDACCAKHMGICQDLAATAVCMLRTQGVYAKLVIGYADAAYHAWVSVYVDGEEILYDPTFELNAMKKPSAYTMERYY